MNMELDDLPPRYRAQAEQQFAARKRRAADPLAEAVKQAKAAGRDFDSRGEYEFYTGTVLSKMARGEIVECEQHPAFPLFPVGEYGTMKLRPIRYTADFRLKYADGTVEIVEIKSEFVRRMQRDYPEIGGFVERLQRDWKSEMPRIKTCFGTRAARPANPWPSSARLSPPCERRRNHQLALFWVEARRNPRL